MKILQLSYRLPYPPKDGGAIGIYNITKAFYSLGHETTLLSFNTKKHFVSPTDIPASFTEMCQLHLVEHNTNLNPIAAFRCLLQNKSYNVERFKSKAFENKLAELLQSEKFDLVQIEGIFLGNYIEIIRKYSTAKIALRAHNVEFHIWQKLAANAAFPKNIYLKILSRQLEIFEKNIWQKVDFVAAINQDELKLIEQTTGKKNVKLFSAGIFPEDFQLEEKQKIPFSLFHLGSMEWMPNVESVDWFLKNVFPKVKTKIPQVKFYLAGRKMPQKYFTQQMEGLEVVGEVENALAFMQNKQLMVVPLLSGGGVRIKIIEAMALGKAIIATSQAAAGLDCTHNENIIIADNSDKMANEIVGILLQNEKIKKLESNAKKFIFENYNQLKLTKKYLQELSNP